MPSPNTNITTLTVNNTVSELMLKINELVYERNLNTMTNPMATDVTFDSSIFVKGDVFVGGNNDSVVAHIANNYAHGVVVENLSYNSNTGILHLIYNDLSSFDITLDISHSITAEQIGLGNVTNESKTVMFTDPLFFGTVSAPTPDPSSSNTQIATTEFVQTKFKELEDYSMALAVLFS